MSLKTIFSILFFTFLFWLSFWLMFHTFSYNSSSGQILIASKAWSDFGGYLPQIRSFSYGKNWPPQYPLFPGEPNRYHFLFYFLVGNLEKLGLPLHFAVNLPSALGFFFLLVGIYFLSLKLFSSRIVSFLSVILFLFNGSFSFLDFLTKYPFTSIAQTFNRLINLTEFVSFGPWNGSIITAFWNLNVFTNQRHLGLSFALVTLIIYFLYTKSKGVYFIGLLMGILIFLNQPSFAIAAVFCLVFFLFSPPLRLPLLLSSLGSLPFVVASYFLVNVSPAVHFRIGFLTPQPVTISALAKFWFYNIGFHIFLIPLGLLLSPRKAKIFIVPLALLFLIPNLLQLSVDQINNHKFFNYFLIVGAMFSAYSLYRIMKIRFLGLILIAPLFLFSILGGIVDFFPVKNDVLLSLDDIPTNPDARFFYTSTPPGSIVLNSTWFYHPASIAGRFIFNGYPYFTWSFGYDQVSREELTASIYAAPHKFVACTLLIVNNISYVELSPGFEKFMVPNWDLWQNQFVPIYENPQSELKIYSVAQNCP